MQSLADVGQAVAKPLGRSVRRSELLKAPRCSGCVRLVAFELLKIHVVYSDFEKINELKCCDYYYYYRNSSSSCCCVFVLLILKICAHNMNF